ncbi:unnamed protein product [Camellia sinensis]
MFCRYGMWQLLKEGRQFTICGLSVVSHILSAYVCSIFVLQVWDPSWYWGYSNQCWEAVEMDYYMSVVQIEASRGEDVTQTGLQAVPV